MMDEHVIERLGQTACYPGEPDAVEIYQTHLSVVCVAGDYAYKLKKAIRLPFVDFSTVVLREHYCHEEIRLNRRLCPDVYLDVVPLYASPRGVTFREEGGGEVVDHAVRMVRLPQERMLSEMLARDEVKAGDLREVARIIAAFHRRGDKGAAVRAAGDPRELRQFAMENFRDTRPMRGTVFDSRLHGLMEEWTRKDFARWLPVLEERGERGRVVDGHGDLHARNICMTAPPTVYDCIEFSAGFRCEDVATENAFLVMDLIYRGHAELARVYLEAYIEESGDDEQRHLMPALVRYRAMVRAKVGAIAGGEEELPSRDREGALASARKHLNLAAASAIAEAGPVLVLACGLPGAGKTHLFEELARESAWPCFSSDRVRKELAGARGKDPLGEDYYSAEFSRMTYAEMLRRAEEELSHQPVLLDANFRSREIRAVARKAARRAGVEVVVLWIRVEEGVARERLMRRKESEKTLSDADLAVYQKLQSAFEAPRAEEGMDVLEVDGALPREENLVRILAWLAERKMAE